MVPRSLLENRKRNRMPLDCAIVSVSGRMHVGQKFRTEQSSRRFTRLEGRRPAQHFTPVVSRHPYGSDRARALVEIQVGGPIDFNATIREIDRTLGVTAKLRQKFGPDRDHFMALMADACNL